MKLRGARPRGLQGVIKRVRSPPPLYVCGAFVLLKQLRLGKEGRRVERSGRLFLFLLNASIFLMSA